LFGGEVLEENKFYDIFNIIEVLDLENVRDVMQGKFFRFNKKKGTVDDPTIGTSYVPYKYAYPFYHEESDRLFIMGGKMIEHSVNESFRIFEIDLEE